MEMIHRAKCHIHMALSPLLSPHITQGQATLQLSYSRTS